jgi:hypothetical protein
MDSFSIMIIHGPLLLPVFSREPCFTRSSRVSKDPLLLKPPGTRLLWVPGGSRNLRLRAVPSILPPRCIACSKFMASDDQHTHCIRCRTCTIEEQRAKDKPKESPLKMVGPESSGGRL